MRLPRSAISTSAVPALIALAALLAVLATIDPAGNYPRSVEGPGLTVDESFNVEQGVRLVAALDAYRVGILDLRDVFGDRNDLGPNPRAGSYYLPDHPPLGRLAIGLCHNLARSIVPPAGDDDRIPYVTACARAASAVAFAALVFLVGVVATCWYGRLGGASAAIAVVLMPRLFGHAHLASLETWTNLTYVGTVLSVAAAWTRPSRSAGPTAKTAAWTGVVFGLALLTKIQAVLLPIPLLVWAVWRWRGRAILPVTIWGLVGLTVFFVGWPWLWLDPANHLREYFGRTMQRQTLYVWYLGRQFADRSVPWHYPFVLFLVTVPVGLHLAGLYGLCTKDRPVWKEPREQLLLGSLVFPPIVFSLPGVTVYDGTRLFLVVFPLWAIFIGRGGAAIFDRLRNRFRPHRAAVVLGLFLAIQSASLFVLSPCWLSGYNLLAGGLRGAVRLGFEPTYWGDSLTRSLLEQTARIVPRGAVVDVVPVLHPFQLDDLLMQSEALRHRGIRLRPYSEQNRHDRRFVLLFRRTAYLPEAIRQGIPSARLRAEVRRDGVQLAALYELEH